MCSFNQIERFPINLVNYFLKIFLKFLATMLGLLSFFPSWTEVFTCGDKCISCSVSTCGVDTITTGAMWTILPLLEIPRSRKYVVISSLCQECRLPPSGSSRFFSSEDLRWELFRHCFTARGLPSSKLEVLIKRTIYWLRVSFIKNIPFKGLFSGSLSKLARMLFCLKSG